MDGYNWTCESTQYLAKGKKGMAASACLKETQYP